MTSAPVTTLTRTGTKAAPRKLLTSLLFVIILPVVAAPVYAIGISFDVGLGGVLEDAILIASQEGEPPRDVVILGDLELSTAEHVLGWPVDPMRTHSWVIGHQAGDVIYSSNMDLEGVEFFSVEPYNDPAWFGLDFPANLDGFVNGTGYSADWWAATVNNHHAHVTADGATAHLWRFAGTGHEIGRMAVNLHSDEAPPIGDETPPIPEPGTLMLFGLGGMILAAVRRCKR